MGVFKIGSVSKFDNSAHSNPRPRPKGNGQPNPSRWKLKRHLTMNHYLIIEITYDDCINFEGRKILMFDKGVTLKDITRQKLIDPHFSESKDFFHPIARFVPTQRGWEMAIDLAISMRG